MTQRSRPFAAFFLSLILVITAQSMAVARGATDATGKLVICSGTLSVTIYVDEDGTPVETPHICPDCLLNALTAILPVDPVIPQKCRMAQGVAPAGAMLCGPAPIHAALARAPPIPV